MTSDNYHRDESLLSELTLRDLFAGFAVLGLIAEPMPPGMKSSTVAITGRYSGEGADAANHFAEAAYILADAMLAERNKPTGETP